jgi:hypothetical protein
MRIAIISILLLVCVPAAYACSFRTGIGLFVSDQENFETKMENSKIALMPSPRVSILSIKRGTVAPGSSCDDAGILKLKVGWPKESAYSLDEIGFYFRADMAKLPDLIFPLVPITTSRVEGSEAEFMFVWLDGHPKHQLPLNFNLEVFAVNKGLQIGPPTVVEVKSD